jgi:hypothetical protein
VGKIGSKIQEVPTRCSQKVAPVLRRGGETLQWLKKVKKKLNILLN